MQFTPLIYIWISLSRSQLHHPNGGHVSYPTDSPSITRPDGVVAVVIISVLSVFQDEEEEEEEEEEEVKQQDTLEMYGRGKRGTVIESRTRVGA